MRCTITGCDSPALSRGWCSLHYQRWRKWRDPLRVGKPHGDGTSYTQAHIRVHRLHGRAADQTCLHCGNPAAEWAYDHSDPDQRVSATGQPYSVDPDHYLPLCRSCHRRFDGISPRRKTA